MAPQVELGDPERHPRVSVLRFDKFHIMAGPRVNIKKFGLAIGIQYTTGGGGEQYHLVSFSNPVEYDPLTNTALQGELSKDMNISYSEVNFFFGVTYGLGK